MASQKNSDNHCVAFGLKSNHSCEKQAGDNRSAHLDISHFSQSFFLFSHLFIKVPIKIEENKWENCGQNVVNYIFQIRNRLKTQGFSEILIIASQFSNWRDNLHFRLLSPSSRGTAQKFPVQIATTSAAALVVQ